MDDLVPSGDLFEELEGPLPADEQILAKLNATLPLEENKQDKAKIEQEMHSKLLEGLRAHADTELTELIRGVPRHITTKIPNLFRNP